MRKRKIYEAEFSCGDTMSFEVFENGDVTVGGENVDSYVVLSSTQDTSLTRTDVKELFVVFRELLKASKK